MAIVDVGGATLKAMEWKRAQDQLAQQKAQAEWQMQNTVNQQNAANILSYLDYLRQQQALQLQQQAQQQSQKQWEQQHALDVEALPSIIAERTASAQRIQQGIISAVDEEIGKYISAGNSVTTAIAYQTDRDKLIDQIATAMNFPKNRVAAILDNMMPAISEKVSTDNVNTAGQLVDLLTGISKDRYTANDYEVVSKQSRLSALLAEVLNEKKFANPADAMAYFRDLTNIPPNQIDSNPNLSPKEKMIAHGYHDLIGLASRKKEENQNYEMGVKAIPSATRPGIAAGAFPNSLTGFYTPEDIQKIQSYAGTQLQLQEEKANKTGGTAGGGGLSASETTRLIGKITDNLQEINGIDKTISILEGSLKDKNLSPEKIQATKAVIREKIQNKNALLAENQNYNMMLGIQAPTTPTTQTTPTTTKSTPTTTKAPATTTTKTTTTAKKPTIVGKLPSGLPPNDYSAIRQFVYNNPNIAAAIANGNTTARKQLVNDCIKAGMDKSKIKIIDATVVYFAQQAAKQSSKKR